MQDTAALDRRAHHAADVWSRFGKSRWDMARFVSDDDVQVIERLRGGRVDRKNDALIGLTAVRTSATSHRRAKAADLP